MQTKFPIRSRVYYINKNDGKKIYGKVCLPPIWVNQELIYHVWANWENSTMGWMPIKTVFSEGKIINKPSWF